MVPRGTKGSVRLDAVEGPLDNPEAIYDLKSGGAKLTPERIEEIRKHPPGGGHEREIRGGQVKARATEQFATRRLLPSLPGFGANGRLLYRRPLGDLLCGCYFEDSSFDKSSFTVHAFVLPLYVPTDQLHLTFGSGWVPDLAPGGTTLESEKSRLARLS